MNPRDEKTVVFEAVTGTKIDQLFDDVSEIVVSLKETNSRLQNLEEWKWKTLGGITAVSAMVSLIVTLLIH